MALSAGRPSKRVPHWSRKVSWLKALAVDDEDASVRVALSETYLAWRHNFNAAAKAAQHKKLARQARQRINQIKRQRGFVGAAESLGEARQADPETVEAPFSWWSGDILSPARPADEVVTVVSGLPRSGTSLMMQMLEAAGLAAMTDAVREADANNPKGYYEYEPVKQLGQGPADWLDGARGRSVKIIAPLLPRLPKEALCNEMWGDQSKSGTKNVESSAFTVLSPPNL
ncbi:MAG: hypothetical protein ACLFU4_05170 [Opitutales bacterium]